MTFVYIYWIVLFARLPPLPTADRRARQAPPSDLNPFANDNTSPPANITDTYLHSGSNNEWVIPLAAATPSVSVNAASHTPLVCYRQGCRACAASDDNTAECAQFCHAYCDDNGKSVRDILWCLSREASADTITAHSTTNSTRLEPDIHRQDMAGIGADGRRW